MSEAQETAVPLSRDGQPILFPQLPYRMHDRVRSFVQDQTIQRFVNKTTLLKDNARKKLAGELFGDDHPAWRELAGQIKAHTLDHLDHYVDRFVEQATAAGAQVH
ncbi:MAG: hypothetical protein OER86_08425, partial [Phycisphaerae bacterium]|nr:hypothetical protein [Phycisphaerae bacterium]